MENTMKRNILLIISDQQRMDTIGYLNRTSCRTPHLDSLIENGVIFSRAVTPCPLCGPARASIFTGLYPHQARGAVDEARNGPLRKEQMVMDAQDMMLNDYSIREKPLLTDLLKAEEYHTCYAGKWHLGNDIIGNWFEKYHGHDDTQYIEWANEKGFPDAWPLLDMTVRSKRDPHMSIPIARENKIDPSMANDAWITDIAIQFIKKRPKDRPFFAVCGLNGPHPPFKIPEPYFSMYDPDSIPEPKNFRPSDSEPESKKQSFYRTLWKDHGTEWQAWQKSVAVYWGFVTQIDDQVGRLKECLKQENILDETLIIFCSDHGEMLGQHGLWHKMQPYEEDLRIPMIFSAPWIKKMGECKELVSLIDIPSTLLSTVGINIPEKYEGIDLTNILEGRTESTGRKYLFSEQKPLGEFHKEKEWRMVCDNQIKYVRNLDDTDELYHLGQDPIEMDNLINREEFRDEKERLRRALCVWMEKTDDPLFPEFPHSDK